MNKILVPTDFSGHAENALSFAIGIANRFGSKITLFHTYKVRSTAGMLVSLDRYMKEDADVDLTSSLEKATAQLIYGATIEGVVVKADAVDSISNKADKQGYDLIVMGTQGASGMAEVFIGSTTNGVIRQSKTPVLAIPEGCQFEAFRSIVLAMDSKEIQSDQILKTLVDLVKGYNAKLSVYHKVEGPEDQGVDAALSYWLDGIEHANHFDFSDETVNDSITRFLEEYGGDLLCMIRHKRGFLASLFHQSVTRKEAFTSKVPLLILQDQ